MSTYWPTTHRLFRWGWLACMATLAAIISVDRAAAQDNALQPAINYVFTGRVDPPTAPEITDRDACIVVLPDRRNNRHVRYYFKRFNMDTAWFSKRYSGRDVLYTLEVEGAETIVEYLTADKSRVSYGFKSTNIPLTGDVDLTKKALERIASLCPAERPKAPF